MPFNLKLKSYQGNCDLCFLKGYRKKVQILREDITIADFWIFLEELTGGTRFRQDHTIQQIVQGVKIQIPIMFEEELNKLESINCFCGD